MTKLRCCFCQQELEINDLDVQLLGCENQNCKHSIHYDTVGTKDMWQELIRTRKALEQSEICCTEWEKQALDYKAENIALSGDLERTRKALDVAVDALNTIKGKHDPRCAVYHIDEKTAYDALDQIKALEQKD